MTLRSPAQPYRYVTVAELAAALRRREVSAAELDAAARAALAQIAPGYNALASLLPERSSAEAKAADRRLADGDTSPLCGVPYVAKDLFAAYGAPTTWGSAEYLGQRFDEDACVIARLARAGGVLTAKAAMVELAGGGRPAAPGASVHGQGRNPWDAQRYSGGSSSGSAIVVATGLVPYALGTETGGSIVGPAAYSGVTGIRPTFGLVPRTGVMMLSRTLDKPGVLARTAADCAAVMAVIAGADRGDTDSNGSFTAFDSGADALRELRIGVIARDADEWEAPTRSRLGLGMAELERVFPRFVQLTLDVDPGINTAIESIITFEAAENFGEQLRRPDFRMTDARQLSELRRGLTMPASELALARSYLDRATVIAARLFADADVVVVATRTDTAPRLDRVRAERQPTASDQMRSLANLAGLPGVSVPCGLADDGMPVGLQLIGPRGSDALLLAVAESYQRTTTYHLLRPPA